MVERDGLRIIAIPWHTCTISEMGYVYMVVQDDAKQSRERERGVREEEGRKVRQEGWSEMSNTLHKLSNAC